MRTKRELYQEAMRAVALRRQTARANAEDARAAAEAAVPALRHAEEEVRVRGVRCALAGASGGDRTAAAAALAKAKRDLWYWNSILKTWNAKGLRTVHDVRGPVAGAGASRNLRVDRETPSGNDFLKNAVRRRSLRKQPDEASQ